MFSAKRAKFHAVQHFFATLLSGAVAGRWRRAGERCSNFSLDGLGVLAGSCPVAIDPLLCKACKGVSMS